MARPPSTRKPARRKRAAAAGAPGSGALVSILAEDGTLVGTDPELSDDTLAYLYRTMVQVREFDRRMLVLQRQGRIGFYGPILGQEAATVGSVAAVEPQDWVFPALREGAAAMMRGLSLTEAIAQLIGNARDRCKGRQMPCHYTYREGRYVSMSSVIGTQISHAVGAAMASRIRGDDVVVLGYMGDGATSANDFHAGMNFAGVMKAPVILFCQNNQWAISVPVSRQHASETIAIKSKAYGIPSVRVDGNDVLAVYEVTRAAAERARAGEGPTFIEALTYRRLGHSSSDDPSRYRDEAEVAAWEKRDPVARMRRFLEQRGSWDDAAEQELQDRIAREVSEAIRVAEDADKPPLDSLITDVYAEVPPALRRQLEENPGP
jgi:pyruvate dehydrogenase E1 component alpha subunit